MSHKKGSSSSNKNIASVDMNMICMNLFFFCCCCMGKNKILNLQKENYENAQLLIAKEESDE